MVAVTVLAVKGLVHVFVQGRLSAALASSLGVIIFILGLATLLAEHERNR